MPGSLKRGPDFVTSSGSQAADADDPVVAEYPVYLCPSAAEDLYLLQYPLHTTDIPAATEARIRSKHNMLEMDHPLPAQNVDQNGAFAMSKRTYQSHSIPIDTHLCLGRFDQSKLYLVPLSHIEQMRPSFKHVVDVGTAEADMPSDQEMEDEPELKPVVYQRKETERAAQVRMNSYAFKKSSEDAEEWVPLPVQNDGGVRAQEMSRMLKTDTKSSAMNVSRKSKQDPNAVYIQSLCYLPEVVETAQNHGTLSDKSTLMTRLIQMMIQGKPMPYTVIRNQFPSSTNDQSLLQALGVCSVTVCGNLCLNSKFLPIDPVLKAARNFVLCLFQRDGFVRRAGLTAVSVGGQGVPGEHWTALLRRLGSRTHGGWQLLVTDDSTLKDSFPEAAAMFAAYWERQMEHFENQLAAYDSRLNSMELDNEC